MNRPLKLAWLSLICLGFALVLPSVRIHVLGSLADFSGWQATWWAVALGRQSLSDISAQPLIATLRQVTLALAAVSNVTLILAALSLLRKNRSTTSAHRWTVFVTVGFLLAVTAPWMLTNPPAHLLIGYYVWLAAYMAALSALVCSRRQRTPGSASGPIAG